MELTIRVDYGTLSTCIPVSSGAGVHAHVVDAARRSFSLGDKARAASNDPCVCLSSFSEPLKPVDSRAIPLCVSLRSLPVSAASLLVRNSSCVATAHHSGDRCQLAGPPRGLGRFVNSDPSAREPAPAWCVRCLIPGVLRSEIRAAEPDVKKRLELRPTVLLSTKKPAATSVHASSSSAAGAPPPAVATSLLVQPAPRSLARHGAPASRAPCESCVLVVSTCAN